MTILLDPSTVRAGGKPPPFADEPEPDAPEQDEPSEERAAER